MNENHFDIEIRLEHKIIFKLVRTKVCLDTIENWKYCNEIIFKCVNSTMRPFLIFFFWIKWLWVPWIVHNISCTMCMNRVSYCSCADKKKRLKCGHKMRCVLAIQTAPKWPYARKDSAPKRWTLSLPNLIGLLNILHFLKPFRKDTFK